MLASLKYQPMVMISDDSTDLITYTSVKNRVFQMLYGPKHWAALAGALHGLIEGDPSQWNAIGGGSGGQSDTTPLAISGIRCDDSAFRKKEFSNLVPLFEELDNVSKWCVLEFGALKDIVCSQWLVSHKRDISRQLQCSN